MTAAKQIHRPYRTGLAVLSTVGLALGVGVSSAAGSNELGCGQTWRDEFTSWDEWRADTGCGWGNGAEPQAYLADNGTIVDLPDGGTAGQLTVRRQQSGGCGFTSGRMTAAETHPFTLGDEPMRFTARLRMPPKGNGLWPAWWLYETDGAGGYCQENCHEIDIVEWLGDTPRVAELHAHDPDGSFGDEYIHTEPLGNAFHEYAVEWDGVDTITWLFDGRPVAEKPDAGVFHGREFMLILNVALLSEGRWPPHPGVDDSTPLPAGMVVDRVDLWTGQAR